MHISFVHLLIKMLIPFLKIYHGVWRIFDGMLPSVWSRWFNQAKNSDHLLHRRPLHPLFGTRLQIPLTLKLILTLFWISWRSSIKNGHLNVSRPSLLPSSIFLILYGTTETILGFKTWKLIGELQPHWLFQTLVFLAMILRWEFGYFKIFQHQSSPS